MLYASGTAGKFNYMVLDLFGQSLEELRKEYKEQMALHVVLHLSLQMLSIIEAIHDRGQHFFRFQIRQELRKDELPFRIDIILV